MTDILKPRDAKDVEAAVGWALAEAKTLEIVGKGSKRGIGRAAQWDLSLDLSGLSGVTLYEPEELVLSAKAGTPLAEIETLLSANNQELAFEPIDYGPLFGAPGGGGTIGGTLAANLSGPRRIKAGAARDHFLGFAAVSGRAESFKSGGRVVKNVTGYDLCKLMAGSWGTLGAMTDVTVKVLPRAETEATLLVLGLDDAKATQAMSAAMNSPNDVSGAAHLPAPVARHVTGADRAVTALRIEGVAPSVTHRMHSLEALLKPFGALATLDEATSRPFWRSVRDVMPFAPTSSHPPLQGEGRREAPGRGHVLDPHPTAARSTSPFQGEVGERVVWRISAAPSRGHEIAAAIGEGEYFYDWAGGLIWLALRSLHDGGASRVRSALAGNGHATLIRAPAGLRASVAVFEPQTQGLAALTRRVKESFDPKGVLGPGRMIAGV